MYALHTFVRSCVRVRNTFIHIRNLENKFEDAMDSFASSPQDWFMDGRSSGLKINSDRAGSRF